ncbi:MAG: NAD(P)H-hydrate dehydratase [Clostridia bacterium]|nr:NAD(P)H-hydrate dehydratase [Clostridia bacterium]
MNYVGREDVYRLFSPMPDRTNKGDMGRVLCVCGSYGVGGAAMCGAAYFSAMAAYRCGAGIVEVFTAKENYNVLGISVPEAVFSLYGCGEDREEISHRLVKSIFHADCIVLGCGLGKSEVSRVLVKTVLENAGVPLIIDADALNIIAENESLWSLMSEEQRARTVITPHPGEMSRLTGKGINKILGDTVLTAESFATERGVICLLKDHNTIITNGNDTYINTSGNAGMATAGMGDVLAGVMGALLARAGGDEVLYRAAVAAYLHGCAGDAAADKKGRYSLIASDVLEALSEVISATN